MGYYLRATIGVVLALAGYALFALGLVKLLHIGTCASGGAYEIARECPAGTGKWAAALPVGIITALIGLGIFAFRGDRPGGERRAVTGFGLGVAAFGLFFFMTGLVALYAEFGPGHSDGPHLGGGIVAAVFIPMGLIALGIAFWSWWADREDAAPEPSPGAAPGSAPTGFSAEGLRKLQELQAQQRQASAAEQAQPVPTPLPTLPRRPGSATVKSFKYLGQSDATSTLVEFELEVSVGGAASYDVVHREMVPLTRTKRLAEGAALRVSVERDNPAELQIVW